MPCHRQVQPPESILSYIKFPSSVLIPDECAIILHNLDTLFNSVSLLPLMGLSLVSLSFSTMLNRLHGCSRSSKVHLSMGKTSSALELVDICGHKLTEKTLVNMYLFFTRSYPVPSWYYTPCPSISGLIGSLTMHGHNKEL
jgi:hypothetical protein